MDLKKLTIMSILLSMLVVNITLVPVFSLKAYGSMSNTVQSERSYAVATSDPPWDDDDADGIPNYIDRTEFNVTWAENTTEAWTKSWHIKAFWIEPSGVGDFKLAVSELGITKAYQYDVTAFVAIELTMLSFANMTEFLYWLASYNLIESTAVPEIASLAVSLNSSDGKLRILPTLQYDLHESMRIRTSEYLLNGSGPPATLFPYFDSEATLENLEDANRFLLNGTEKEKKKKPMDILGMIEEAWDLITSTAKGFWDFVEKILEKLKDYFIKDVIDRVKELLKAKSWWDRLKKALKLSKKVLKRASAVAQVLDILKRVIKKISLEPDTWWWKILTTIDPPEPDFLNEKVDMHLYDLAGNHLLGMDYATNTTITTFEHGIYSGSLPHEQFMLISKLGMPYNLTIISKEPTTNIYVLDVDDPLENKTVIATGDLSPNEVTSGLVYLHGNITYINQLIVSSIPATTSPTQGQIIDVNIKVTDENGTAVSDANLTIRATNGTHTYYYDYDNLGGGYYASWIDTSELLGGYFVYTVAEKSGLLHGSEKFIMVVYSPPVGGIWIPVDKFSLLAHYIALASTILVATAATAIYVKRVKRRKKKQ